MEKFKLIITKTLEKEVEIEAENINDAFNKAELMYNEGQIILSDESYKETLIEDQDKTRERYI